VTVPLAWKGKYDAGVAEANARVLAAEADRRRTVDDVRRDVEQAYARARTALVQHDLFGGTHVPHAEQALRVTEAAYVAGETDLGSMLETVRNVERVHLEHLMATADFEKAYADLERAVGAELPRPTSRRTHHD
jgi:outer membrane protein TolC